VANVDLMVCKAQPVHLVLLVLRDLEDPVSGDHLAHQDPMVHQGSQGFKVSKDSEDLLEVAVFRAVLGSLEKLVELVEPGRLAAVDSQECRALTDNRDRVVRQAQEVRMTLCCCEIYT